MSNDASSLQSSRLGISGSSGAVQLLIISNEALDYRQQFAAPALSLVEP